ncbi:MAG: Ig-like domain-containing protein [Terracidiphilus sp.]
MPALTLFKIDPTTTCLHPGALGAGASCAIAITFDPIPSSTLPTSTLTITTNASNSPQRVTLSGTAQGQVTLSAAALNFGNQAVGETSAVVPVTLTNNQSSALKISSIAMMPGSEYSIAPSTTCPNFGTMAAGASCTIGLTFTPTALGAQPAGTLQIVSNGPSSPQSVTMVGTGVAQVALSPASLSFAAQFIGSTSGIQSVTVTNQQIVPLLITSANVSGANASDFGIGGNCPIAPATLLPGLSCQLTVNFTPSVAGTRTATLNLADNAPSSPQTVTLTGISNAPVTVLPGLITNFHAPVGSTSAYQSITITNVQTATLHISGLQMSGDFIQTASNCPIGGAGLAGGASCTVSVEFEPTIGGVRGGQLQVFDDVATSPQVVNLSGTGTSPLTFTPSSMIFSAEKLGTVSPSQGLVLTNHESQPENFSISITGSSDFTTTNSCPSGVVAANSSCTIAVVFAPPLSETPGPVYGAMTITNSAQGNIPCPGAGALCPVSLTGSATSQNPPAAVQWVSPGAGAAGTTVNVIITGNNWTHFNSSSVISFVDTDSSSYDSDISVQSFTAPDANHINAALVIAGGSNTIYGARDIYVNTPLSSGGTETAYLFQAFIIADPANAHVITNLSPATGSQGQTLNVALTATGTHFVQGTTIANFGDGVNVNWLTITDPTDAVANITISNWTPVGLRTVTLATGGEFAVTGYDTENAPAGVPTFQINANNATLLGVSPNSEGQSWAGPISITASGSHFVPNGTQVSIGGGVIVGDVNVLSPTTATAQIAVPANATPGTWNVTVSTGGEIESLASAFTVINTTPAIAGVSPNSGAQGQTLTVTISGNQFTNFVAGQVAVNFGDSVIPFWVPSTGFVTVNGSPTVIDAHRVQVNVTVSPYAGLGTINAYLTSGPSGAATIFPFTFTVMQSSAAILSVQPVNVPQGGQVTLTLQGSNTHWNQAQTTAGPLPLCFGTVPIVNEVIVTDATDAQLNITVPAGTPVGSYSFYVATGGEIIVVSPGVCVFAAGEVVTGSINVYPHTPTLTMSPANGYLPSAGSNSFPVNFTGEFTHFTQSTPALPADTLPVIAGQGVSLSNFSVTSTGSATATLTIAAGAATGPRLVTFTTGAEIVTTYFNVTSTPAKLVSIDPWHAGQSLTLDVAIVGQYTHFAQATTQVLFGPQITVNSVTVTDATHLTANISASYIDPVTGVLTATPPGWKTVYVNTGSEQVIGGFRVDWPATPTIVSVLPSSAQQGSTYDVTITGNLTNWQQGQTEAILGAGVTVANLTITSPTTATATIAVSPTAPVGGNSVVFITDTGLGTEEIDTGMGFSVTPSAASIATIQPNFTCVNTYAVEDNGQANNCNSAFGIMVVAQLQTATLNISATGTHWLQGETIADLGSNVHIDNLTVNSPTSATIQFTVLSTAPVGFASLTMITGGEVITLSDAIDIEEGFATLLAYSPGGAQQGNTMTMQLLGRFTHWDSTTSAAFAPAGDLTVNSVNVIDSETMTINVTVSPWAYVDFFYPCGHTLTVTTTDVIDSNGSVEQVTTDPNVIGNFCVAPGAEEITGVSPLTGVQGSTETLTITGSATNFIAGVTAVSFNDPNFQVGQITVNSPSSLSVPVGISTAASTGFKIATVSTYGQTATQQFSFTVTPGVAILTEANPYQAEQGVQNLDVILTGEYSHFSSLSTTTFGTGIVVNSVTSNSPTQITANISIDPLSYTGGRTVTVTTPGVSCAYQPVNVTYEGCTAGVTTGTGSEIVTASAFNIIPGPAIMSNVSPNTGNEGQEVIFNITGSATHWQQNFTQFYMDGVGSDITVNSVVINSATSATADINISATSNPGARSIYMLTAGESLIDSGAFVVTGGIPVITTLRPNNAVQGTNQLQVTIKGNQYTTWDSTSTVNFGPGITITSLQLDDASHIEAVINVDPAAQPGYRTVTVQTGTQVLAQDFMVSAPAPPPTPYISYYLPNSGLTGQTLTVSFSGTYTHWDPGPINTPTTVTYGDGIAMNWEQVLSPTSFIANITIGADAMPGQRLFVFSTGSEEEDVPFNVVSSTPAGSGGTGAVQPALSIVDPGSGVQGAQNMTVNIIGQYTTFDNTTTFSFGSGITTVGPPMIIGPTIATQVISINQLAPLGGSSVVATTPDVTGSAQVVSGAGFTVTPSLALISTVTPNTALQGNTITVEVTGQNTHWDGSTVFTAGEGITVSNPSVNSAADAFITLTIPTLAPLGATYVTATTGGEVATLANGFVVQAGTPLLLSSGPGSLPQQSSATFTILSQATHWLSNTPSVSYGSGVAVSNVNVTSDTSLTVEGYVQPTTFVGWRDLTVVSGTQVLGLQNAFYVNSGPAAINSVSPPTAGQGATLDVSISGTNTNWAQGVTQLNFPGALVNNYTVNSPSSISANITVSDYAPAGEVTVTATTLGEVATGGNVFLVFQTQPELLAAVPSSQVQGWTGTVTLTGAFTHFTGGVSAVSFGTGITINSATVLSLTSLQANITVLPTATPGYRNISVTTGSEAVSLNNGFQVLAGPAAIASLNPNSGAQGASLSVVVTGSQSDFASGVTTAAIGGGINITGITVNDALHITLNISIPNSTAVGQYDLILTTGGEVATILGGFTVTVGNPQLSQVNPPTAHQGDTNINVNLTGLFTNFVSGISTASFGAGITVNSLTVTDSTDAVANISISPSASIGSRTVTVTTGLETATRIGGLSVLAGVPQLLSATPSLAQAGATANIVITGKFTTFQQNFSTVSLGTGVTVNSVVVSGLAQLTANISVDPNTTPGSRDITVTTNSQTETLSGGFTVTPGTPAITQINPNIGSPSQTVTVTLIGQYTNWGAATTASFGPAISVGGAAEGAAGPVTVTNANTLTASLTIDPNAAFGPVDVIVSTGSEIETVAAGFTVQPPVVSPPTVVSLSPGDYTPPNSNIIVVFSQPMMRSTINTNNVFLFLTSNPNGTISVPGTVTLDASGLVMAFTPNALLAVNSTYNLQLTGSIQDATGNAFGGYSANLFTGFNPNTTPPTVVAANPPAKANSVGANLSIQLEFSTAMDQSTSAGVTVSANGTNIAGTYSWNSSPWCPWWSPCEWGPATILTFTPATPLAANTAYTVSYGAPLADTAGNALTPGSFTFTTGSAADTANNSASADFASWESNLGTNFAPRMNFSKPVNPININTGTLYLYNYDSGKYQKGAVSVAPDGLSATFTPTLPLLPNTAYTLYMSSGSYDMDGNYLYGINGYFTTGSGSDLAPPTVASIFPASASAAVPLNAQVVAHFSESIDPDSSYTMTVTPTAGGAPIIGSATLASDQVTLTFVSYALQPGTQYTVQISGYSDMAGNAGAAFTSTFTTAASVAPLNLYTGLDASGNLITTGGTADPHWTVIPTGATTPQTAYVVAPGEGGWSPNWSSYGYADGPVSSVITVDPTTAQGYPDSTYSTTFNLSSYNLNNLCLVGAVQGDPYGTLILNGNVISAQYYPWQGLAPINLTLPSGYLNSGVNTLSYQLASGWDGYEGFRLQGSIQTCGASLFGGLSLVSATPASGSTNVATNTAITLTFNGPIDPATVSSNTLLVTINQDSYQSIAGSYQVNGNTVTFTPDSTFPVNTTIWVYANGLHDTAGESVNSWLLSFTTASTASPVTPAPPPFQVIAFTPSAGAANVGLRAPVVATFNRSVNPSTINQSSATADFALFNGDAQSPWCQSYSKSQDNTTLQFNCSPLPSSATMTAMLNSNLQDFAGDALPNFTSQFTTMAWDSSGAGSLVTARPGSGSSGISATSPIVFYMNLPINPDSANAALQVAQNNVALQGTVQVLDNGYTLEFTPGSPWAPGALVQWWINGSLTDATNNNSFSSTSGYFYVAADTGTLTPVIQVMSPPEGTYAAPNDIVDVQFNTALDPTTVNSSNIYLYDYYTGLNVATAYSMPQPNEVRLVPTGNLNANDYILLYVTAGLTSTTSVPAAANNGWNNYFYTGNPVDTTLPVVTNAVPYSGAANVGVNVQPGVVFNKAIDPVSVNASTFQVTQNGAPLAGGYWISSDDKRVEFAPNAPLPASASLVMTLKGVLDPVGNPVSFTSSFQTAAGPDLTAPTVVDTSVSSNESIPVNSSITVQFSESMDVTTFNSGDFYIEDALLNTQVPATLSWSADQSVAYLVPSAPLAAGREYYLYISSGSDLAGNQLQGWTGLWYGQWELYFYTDFTANTSAPTVVHFNPRSGTTGLGTNAIIEAQFSAPLDPNTLSGVTLSANGSPVLITRSLSAGNTVLQLQPQTPLTPNTAYLLTVAGVQDPAGNTVATVTNSFTTGATFDITPPSVVSYDPPYSATVGTNANPRLVFNKPLNPITVSNSTFSLYLVDTGQWIPLTVTLSPNELEVTLQPRIPLLPNTQYHFQACCGYQDQDGNNGNQADIYFYTASGAVTTGPTVIVSPASGATGIPLNTQVLASVSEAIDPTSWSQSSINMQDSGSNPVAGTVSQTDSQTLLFVPTNPLSPGMTYSVNVNGFTDATGNAVVPATTTFATGTAVSTTGLSLTSANIPLGSTNVSATSPIILTFSQILDPTTVTSSTLPVMTGWASGTLAGAYAVSGNTVTFVPISPYPPGATIYVGECGGPTDVLGEVFYNGGCWQQQLTTFTVTTATPDTEPLQVVSVNPANGAVNVRHEIPVSVTFNKSINPSTANLWTSARYNQNAQLYIGQDLQYYGSVSLSADNRTLTFNTGALQDATTYTILLPAAGITDMSGNALAANFISTFTTATNPTPGAGSVTTVSPNWSSTGVPTDALLTLYVNRQVDPSSLPGNLTVTVNGQVYAGTVQSVASGYEVQYTPNTPFPNGAVVQWFFAGNVLDVYGDAFSANSGYFYTMAAVDPITAVPMVVAISPASSTNMMPINGEIDIEFSQPIDPASLNGNISLYDGTPVTLALASPNVVRVTPNPALNPSTGDYVNITGTILGVNGVAAQTNYWTDYFTTTSGPDTTSGTVKIGPPDGSVNVGTNAFIRLQFSKPVDITTIHSTTVQVTASGNPIEGSWSYNYSGNDVIGANFHPVNPLPPSSTIQVSVSGLLDYAGNTFASASAQFTTAALPDFTSANASYDFNSYYYNVTYGIATNASFTCRYSKPMDPSSINPSGSYVYSYVTNAAIPMTYTFSSDLMSVTMKPITQLFTNAEYYYICTGAIDLTGNAQNNSYWYNYAYFYTGSGPSSAGPVLIQANPPNGMTNVPVNSNNGPWAGTSLGLLFNEPVAADSLGGITLTAIPMAGGAASTVPISFYPEYGNTILAVQLPWSLLPNTTYTYNVTGVSDYNGNPMTPATSTFTTGSSFDWTNPTITASNPANGVSDVDVNSTLSVTFSEAMDPVIITSSQIYLQNQNTGATIPATLSLSPDYTTIFLTPSAPLDPATIFNLVYWPNNWYLTGIAGNPANNYGTISTFTTNTPATINGACGSANGQSFSAPPTTNLCSAGTVSALTNPGSWTWSCNGEYGGSSASCSANVSLTSAPIPQPAGLVGWWPGNDNADDIIGGNNGTLENGASFALGEVGDAFSLNGNDQYVFIGEPVPANLQIQNAITLSAWIYPTALPTDNGSGALGLIVGSQHDGSPFGGATIFFDGRADSDNVTGAPPGHINFGIGDTSGIGHITHTLTQVPLNQWTLVTAVVAANSACQIYYNGVIQPEAMPPGESLWNGTVSYTGSWFAIGQEVDENRPFTGLIDEVQVYNTALTAGEVQAIYNAGAAGMVAVETASSTTVSSSASPAEFGVSVTFTASVSPGSATGTITFFDGTTQLGLPVTLSSGQATFTTSALALGVHSIIALYSGDSTYSGSQSPTISQIENLDGASCAPQPAGLIDWYQAEANTNDIIGGNNGTVEGSVSYAQGSVGQAFNFSRSGDVLVSLPTVNTSQGTQVTVAFWMNWGGGDQEIPFSFTSPSAELYFKNGYFGFNTNNGDIWGISSSGLANTWIFVTAVFDNGDPHTNQLYINGIQQSLSQQMGSTPSSSQVSTQAWIGAQNFNSYGGSYAFGGLLDEIQIYNRALTLAEVQNIYRTGAAGVCQAQTATTTTVTTSGSPAGVGASVTFTASVSPSTATGTTTFFDGTTQLGSAVTLNSGQATYSTSALVFGSHSITAVYSGDTTNAGSTSAPLAQVINMNGAACLPLPANAVAWWAFDETSGPTSADWFGNSTGTWVNSPVPAPGEVLNALRFNGSNYVTVPNSQLWNFSTTDFTTELWANWDTQPTGGSIGYPASVFAADDDGGGSQNKWIFSLGGGVLQLIVYNTVQPPSHIALVQAPFTPLIGQWYHLAITKTENLYTIYVNGEAVGSDTLSSPIGAASAPLTIGQAEGIGYMQGSLDELTIYNRGLAANEIQAIYNAGGAGKCKN